MLEQQFERLVAAGIQLIPMDQVSRHFVFERGGFVALVEKKDEGFGNIGAAGLVTEQGFAALSWRGSQPLFVAKNFEITATPEQVDNLRAFERDLHAALAG